MFQFNSTFKKILTSTVLSLCAFTLYAQKEQEVKITVDTDFVIEDNYFGGAVQWEPNDRDTLPEWKWQRLLNRVRELKLGYIRCCIRSETLLPTFGIKMPPQKRIILLPCRE